MEEKIKDKLWWLVGIVGIVALLAIGFALLPAILRKIKDMKLKKGLEEQL